MNLAAERSYEFDSIHRFEVPSVIADLSAPIQPCFHSNRADLSLENVFFIDFRRNFLIGNEAQYSAA